MLSPEIRWLLRHAWPFRKLYLIRLSAAVFVSLLSLVDPLILKWIIDEILPWRKTEMLVVAATSFFVIFMLRFAFNYLGGAIDTHTAQRLAFHIRRKLLRHLQSLSADYYLTTSRGETLHRLEQDIDQICLLGGRTLERLLRVGVMTSLSIAIMLLLNWRLTLFVLALVPLLIVLRNYSHPKLKKISDRVQETCARRIGFLESHLASMTQIQLLNRTASERRRFAKIARRGIDVNVRRYQVETLFSFSAETPLMAAVALVLGFGGLQVVQGGLTVGGLVAFHSYLYRIFAPMELFVQMYSQLQRASSSIRRVKELFAIAPTIVDPPVPRRLTGGHGLAVELRGVSFAYQPDHDILDRLDLRIRPGEKVALVGKSGCGKSTVSRLLTRLYDPRAGEVLLDAIPVRSLRLCDLRRRIALVSQDPVLFDESLKNNLLYARPDASDEELRQVLALAQLEQIVDELPNGWMERVGQRGERLSGGQRQRVAVARAILQDPRLLILDEATSALDGFTEYRLLHGLRKLTENRTVLLIAHRLSAILWADRIIVLERGRVLADGTHQTLYESCDLYRELCEKQLREAGSDAEAVDDSKQNPRKVVAF